MSAVSPKRPTAAHAHAPPPPPPQYSLVRASNYGATLWFIAWVLIGRYLFLSLFLTAILDAFETQYEQRKSLVRCTACTACTL